MTDLIRNRLEINDAVERIIPEEEIAGILSIHLKRYQFATSFTQGKNVLDAAAGVSYGAAYLSQVAKQVIGIDIDKVAIDYGQRKYKNDNRRTNCCQSPSKITTSF